MLSFQKSQVTIHIGCVPLKKLGTNSNSEIPCAKTSIIVCTMYCCQTRCHKQHLEIHICLQQENNSHSLVP